MKGHHFPNYGYIRCSLPSPLFQSLKKECKTAESNTPLTTGLTATPGSADHYLMSEKTTQKLFEFQYTPSTGVLTDFKLNLTPKDEGDLVIFPATLPHIVYPFPHKGKKRISISGNILLDARK